METQYRLLPYSTLEAFCHAVFARYGFTAAESEQITDVLLAADLAGIESHGIQRLIRYHHEITDGLVKLDAKPEIVHETPLSAVLDAHDAMGQLVGVQAMQLAIQKAKATGAGFVTVRNSNHYGIAGYYTHMAAEQDLLGVCMTNTEAIMVPTFGRQAMLGTNHIAVAMPADPVIFSFDAATTVVPRGKLEVYRKRGDATPPGWIVDVNGNESTDPDDVLENIIAKRGGGILPIGGAGDQTAGYKGYGFGLICELFTGILSGGTTSNYIYRTPGRSNIAQCFIALDYGMFGDKAALRARFSTLLSELRQAQKAVGRERIYVHGEKEHEARANRLEKGVPVNDKTYQEMHEIAIQMGVDPLAYLPD